MLEDSKQIYIVDDDESVRRALEILLRTCRFKVRTFYSSEEFFSAVPISEPGLLILDIHMPGLSGWETLLRLSRAGSQRQVIVITADKNGGLKEKALKVGAVGFFQKPINDQELIDLINHVFQSEKAVLKASHVISSK